MIAHAIDSSRVIGCVVYPSTVIVEPSVIEHIEGNRFSIGELDGTSSERCKRLAASLICAGLRALIRGHVRHDMWIKLLGNVVFNPMSALTGLPSLKWPPTASPATSYGPLWLMPLPKAWEFAFR